LSLPEVYTAWLHRRCGAVILVVALGIAALAAGLAKVGIDTDLRVYFSTDSPPMQVLERFESRFEAQSNVFLYLQPADGDIFTPHGLGAVEWLTERAWSLDGISRVRSVTNFQHTYARGDEIVVEPLVADAGDLSPAVLARVRDIALGEPALRHLLVSPSGGVGALDVNFVTYQRGGPVDEAIYADADALRQRLHQEQPGLTVLLGGSAVANRDLSLGVKNDLTFLVPLSYGLILVGLFLLLRDLTSVLIILAVISCSVVGAVGLFGWLGVPLTPTAGFAPSIILTIAVADCVHFLTSYFLQQGHGRSRLEAMAETLRINFAPILLTTVTTIIGALFLNLSDSPPYRSLGNLIALGTLLAWLLSMTLLPAILLAARPPATLPQVAFQDAMARLGDWVQVRRRVLLGTTGGVTVALLLGIGQNRLTEDWVGYFDDSFEIRRTVEAVDAHLTGIHRIEYLLAAHGEGAVYEPAFLQQVDAFVNWLRAQEGVAVVLGISDLFKRLNQVMHGDDPAWYRLPASRALAAQYLLLHEMSLDPRLGLDNLVTFDRSATRVTLLRHRTDSETLLRLEERASDWLREHAPAISPARGTSMDIVFGHIARSNIRQMLIGAVLALLCISVVLLLALRSPRLGSIALLTNLAPAGLAYGLWGLTVGEVGLSLSVVICMSLGIVVDDTVHFLSKYFYARRQLGLGNQAAVSFVFRNVGVAMLITSLVLVAGFLVLSVSALSPTRGVGTLLAVTLSFALLVDFFMVPPLLLALDRADRPRPWPARRRADGPVR
jgi:predicted RND superfamily exporter protein